MISFRNSGRTAQGFTLVELLVVIAIIGVLAALTVTGVMRVIDGQNEANTRTAIQAAYSILQKQWGKVVADAKKETPSPAVHALADDDRERAQVIWVKLRLMEAFPASFSEVNSFWPYSANLIPAGSRKNISTYQQRIASAGALDAVTQSSVCLVLALSLNRGGAVLDEDKLGPFLKTTSSGARYLADGFGNAIAFCRFPTQNAELQKLSPAKSGMGAKFKDPLDPDGTLSSSTWSAASLAIFQGNVHQVTQGSEIAYIIPTIFSVGPDGKPGVNLSELGSGTADAYDNIYSFFLKAGATGN